jgi:hypothetical protein
MQRIAPWVAQVVLTLGIDISPAHLNGRKLIAPNATIENFLLAGRRVKAPVSILLDQWDWHWPVVLTDL